MKKFLYIISLCLLASCSTIAPNPKTIIIHKTVVIREHIHTKKSSFDGAVDGCRNYGWKLNGCDAIFQKLQHSNDQFKTQEQIDNAVGKLTK